MGKKLIITEKPSVARQFAAALGVSGNQEGYIENNEWVITWCLGHLVTLSYPEKYNEELARWEIEALPFLPENYKYEVIKNSAQQYKVVKKLLNRSDVDVIYNAGDSGREGEYIQRLVYNQAGVEGKKKILRVWIDSQTDAEIKRGIKDAKPESEYDSLSAAAYERAIADYAVGINLSRALSCKYGWSFNQRAKTKKYVAMAVGRVMTCTLGMIVDREREIRSFVPTDYFKIDTKLNEFTAHWKPVKGTKYYESDLLYNENGFKKKDDAAKLLSEFTTDPVLDVIRADKKQELRKAPLLYNLAELQADCSKKFKIPPSRTLEIAQTLYEKKLTTYPRTDARVLSTPVAKEIDKNLRGLSKVLGWKEIGPVLNGGWYSGLEKTKYVDDTRITDHYAIIPTGEGGSELNNISELERKVYELIAKRFLAIFYPAAEYAKTDVELVHKNGEHFFASEKVLIKNGYLELYKNDPAENTQNSNSSNAGIGFVKAGQKLCGEFEIIESATTPPKPYTSGSIILAMENAGKLIEDDELRAQIKGSGIGTSATRAETISKLTKQTYISLNNKTQVLSPTLAGETLYNIVKETVPSMLSPKMTASWELGLSQVENGEIKASRYRTTLEKFVRDSVTTIKEKPMPERPKIEKKSAGTCPVCGKELLMTEKGYFCSDHKRDGKGCGFAFAKEACGHTLTEDEIGALLKGEPTDYIEGLVGRSGSKFTARFVVDKKTGDIKLEFPSWESDMICPKCGSRMREGENFYNCECGFSFPVRMASRPFTQDDIDMLVKNGYREIHGFRSKKGTEFSANVTYRNGKVEFDFGDSGKKKRKKN